MAQPTKRMAINGKLTDSRNIPAKNRDPTSPPPHSRYRTGRTTCFLIRDRTSRSDDKLPFRFRIAPSYSPRLFFSANSTPPSRVKSGSSNRNRSSHFDLFLSSLQKKYLPRSDSRISIDNGLFRPDSGTIASILHQGHKAVLPLSVHWRIALGLNNRQQKKHPHHRLINTSARWFELFP